MWGEQGSASKVATFITLKLGVIYHHVQKEKVEIKLD